MKDRELERLKWRSRRGLLELDLVFARFWEKHETSLDSGERQRLDRLLQMPDNDLLDLVMQRRPCEDRQLAPLVRMLQEA
jgi:antitoxin CptB